MAKNKNPGDKDLNFDDDWDSELDNIDSDIEDFNFDDDLGEEESESREPTSSLKSSIVSAAKSAATGTASGLAGSITNVIAHRMPGVKEVFADISGATDELSELRNDVGDKFRPVLNETAKVSKKLVGAAKNVLPSSISDRLIKFLDNHIDEDNYQYDKQAEQNERVSSVLAEVFKEQTEQQVEDRKQDQVNKVIDRRLAYSRHNQQLSALSDIRTSIFYQTAFYRTTFTAYLKKNLEIQYRQLFAAEDTLKLFGDTASMLQQRLDSIVHNTALPDANKIYLGEKMSLTLKERMMSGISDKITKYLGGIRTNISKEFLDPVADMASQLLGVGEMSTDMLDMKGGLSADDITSSIGGFGGNKLGSTIGGRLIKRILSKAPTDIVNRIGAIGRNSRTGVIKFLNDLQTGNSRLINGDDGSYNSILDSVAGLILPSFKNENSVTNLRYGELDKPASLTNRTLETIEQIIPGYLSLQTKFLETIATGREGSTRVWDFEKEQFVTEDELFSKFTTDTFGNRELQTARMQSGVEHTAAILDESVPDDLRRSEIFASYKTIAAEVEKFKINLASSSELLLLDTVSASEDGMRTNSTIDALNSIASGMDSYDQVINTGFKGIKHPKEVATWLLSLFTTETGEVNKQALTSFNTEIIRVRDTIDTTFKKAALHYETVTRQTDVLKPFTKSTKGGVRTFDFSKVSKEFYSNVDTSKLDFSRKADLSNGDNDSFKQYLKAKERETEAGAEAARRESLIKKLDDRTFGKLDTAIDKGLSALNTKFSSQFSTVGDGVRKILNKIDSQGEEARIYDTATNLDEDNVVGEAGAEAVVPLTNRDTAREGVSVIADKALTEEEAKKVKEAVGKAPNKHAAGGIFSKIFDKFTKKESIKTAFDKSKYKKYTTKDILIEQLGILREIADKPAFAVDISKLEMSGAKKTYSKVRNSLSHLVHGIAETGIGIASGLFRMPAAFIGTNLDIASALLFNRVCDVYRKPENDDDPLGDPLVTVDDFKAGLYNHPEKRDSKHRIKSTDDITKPIWRNKDIGGVPAISKADIKAGLVDKKRKPINSLARRIGNMLRRVNATAFGTLGKGLDILTGIRPVDAIRSMVHAPAQILRGVLNRNVDVYSKLNPDKCLLHASKIKRGLYMIKNANGHFAILHHISEINGPVWCTENPDNGEDAGNIVLTAEDYDNGKGLCDKYGRPLQDIFRSIGNAGRWTLDKVTSGVSGVTNLGLKLATSVIKMGWKAAKSLFRVKDPYIDVYVYDDNNEKRLRLQGVKIREGAYFTLENGIATTLETAYGIKSPVYQLGDHGKPKMLINEEEIRRGLYDIDGNKLTEFAGRSIIGKATILALTGAKNLASLAGRAIWKGMSVVGRGVGKALGLGKDVINVFTNSIRKVLGGFRELWITRKDLEEVVGDRLLDIYHLLYTRLSNDAVDHNDKNNDGIRDGSYEDYQKKRKAKIDKYDEDVEKANSKSTNKNTLGGFGNIFKKSEDGGSLLGDIISGNIISKGIDKAGSILKKGAGALGGLLKGKFGTVGSSVLGGLASGAKTIGSLGLSSIAKLVPAGLTGLFSSGALASGLGSLTSGIGGSAAALASNPVGWGIAAALAAGATGYGIYKLVSDSDIAKKWRKSRLKAYRINGKYDSEINKLEKLTWECWNNTKQYPDDADLIQFAKDIGFIDNGKLFGMIGGDEASLVRKKKEYVKQWFVYTFAPVFATFARVVKQLDNKEPGEFPDVDNIDEKIEPGVFKLFNNLLTNKYSKNFALTNTAFAKFTEEQKPKTSKDVQYPTANANNNVNQEIKPSVTEDKTEETPQVTKTLFAKLKDNLFSSAEKTIGAIIPTKVISTITSNLESIFADTKKENLQQNFLQTRFAAYFGNKSTETNELFNSNNYRMLTFMEYKYSGFLDGHVTLDELTKYITNFIRSNVKLDLFFKYAKSRLSTGDQTYMFQSSDSYLGTMFDQFVSMWISTRFGKLAGMYIGLLRAAVAKNRKDKVNGIPELYRLNTEQRQAVIEAFNNYCTTLNRDTEFNATNFAKFVATDVIGDRPINSIELSKYNSSIKEYRDNEKDDLRKVETTESSTGTKLTSAEVDHKLSESARERANTSISAANVNYHLAKANLNTTTDTNTNIPPKPKLSSQTEFGKKIWDHFKQKGWTDSGVAGMLGNLQKESGVEAVRKQAMTGQELRQDKDRSLSMQYTEEADRNPASFTNPRSVGYGLAQWTTKSRKESLLDFAHSQNKSVGDEGIQIDFLDKELSEQYKPMVKRMSKSDDIVTSTADFLRNFERPADQSDREVLDRAGFSKLWLEKFGKPAENKVAEATTEISTDTGEPSIGTDSTVTSDVPTEPIKTSSAISPAVAAGVATQLKDSAVETSVPVEAIRTQTTNASSNLQTVPVSAKLDAEVNERQISELRTSNNLLKAILDVLQKTSDTESKENEEVTTIKEPETNNESIVDAVVKSSEETRATLVSLFDRYFSEATSKQPAKAQVVNKPQRKMEFPLNISKR